MEVPERVHIIPLGYEYERVIKPPQQLNADKVVLLTHKSDADAPDYHDAARKELGAGNIELIERNSNLFDLYTCLGAIAEIITNHDGDEVYVNLSTGSKVTAIAGMIACMATGANPYYVSAERYGPEESEDPPENPVSFGVANIEQLSSYPIDAPSEQTVRILNFIADEGPVSKKEIIHFGEEHDLEFLRNAEASSMQGKYRRLEAHVMENLEENGYVEMEQQGRKRIATITQDGRNTIQAFGYLID